MIVLSVLWSLGYGVSAVAFAGFAIVIVALVVWACVEGHRDAKKVIARLQSHGLVTFGDLARAMS